MHQSQFYIDLFISIQCNPVWYILAINLTIIFGQAIKKETIKGLSMNRAQEGDTVTVTFQGVLDDGSVFDESNDSDPLVFVLGENEVLPGMEMAVLGMEVGDRKTVTVPPEQGYGVHQSRLVEEVDIGALPKGIELDVGGQLEVTAADGTAFQLLIVKLDEQTVTLDGNHPLAGVPLILQIELVSIDRPTLN
jgi:FKBP-type peptidyl-prolyl cis-trans isomerase 2